MEPDPAMLAELHSRFPGAESAEGSAEAIPLPDSSVDAVVAGQAWHWFDPELAPAEIARVLRPGGVVAALWNGDDTDVDWVRGLHEAGSWRRAAPAARGPAPAFLQHAAFGPAEHGAFPNPVRTSATGLVATLGTHSWALVAEPAERDAALGRVRDYLATRPETSAGEFEFPLVTEVIRALRT
ncbi:hypothetical protein BJF78_13280 [Pseudonocardia sp. CNS-139]|nr:hypothetical protein BJF78_13280 [Pseudonocardia sp. CNS-139]